MKYIFTALCFAISLTLYAQQNLTYETLPAKASPLKGTVSVKNITKDFFDIMPNKVKLKPF